MTANIPMMKKNK